MPARPSSRPSASSSSTTALYAVRLGIISLSERRVSLVKLQAKGLDLSAATYPGIDVVLQVPQAGGASVITAKANRTCKVGTKILKCK